MVLSEKRRHVVIVDDNPVNLDLAESVLKEYFKLTKLISGRQLLKFLTRIKPDMILLDIQMPEMDGYETLQEVKRIPKMDDVPIIILTGQKDNDSEREGFRLGAQDFIAKPFDNGVLLSRVRSQMELYEYRTRLEEIILEKTRRIEDLQHMITVSWAEMVESRDGTTGSHVRNTTRYFKTLLGIISAIPSYAECLKEEALDEIVRASTMHDIGKISISDTVLKKPGPLSAEEFESMKTHSRIGANMIQKVIDNTRLDEFLGYAKNMALYHHERWDGTGYPCGLKEEEIPLYVRILSIADVYDALTSIRPYKRAFTHEEALNIMSGDRGKFFSPELFDIFYNNNKVLQKILEDESA